MIDQERLARVLPRLEELLDKAEITDLVSRLGRILDERRFEDIRSIATEDVVADFPTHAAAAQLRGVEALTEHGRRSMGRFERTQHVTTNVMIDLDGDRARVRANLIATHVRAAGQPNVHYDAGEYYLFDAVRTPEGWRLCRINPNAVWYAGERPGRA